MEFKDDQPLLGGQVDEPSMSINGSAAAAAAGPVEKTEEEKELSLQRRRDEEDAKSGVIKLDWNEKVEDDPNDIPEYMRGRDTVDNELEDAMDCKPFTTIPLFYGQKNASTALGQYRQVGDFKGLIRVSSNKEATFDLDLKELLKPKHVFVRVYVLRGHRLNPKDRDGTSDPYLIAQLGDQKISTRDRYIPSNLDPDFYEVFEFGTTIPGDTRFELTVMDWDGIGDDLIGTTAIDLEDRWFSKEWRKTEIKPVEIRTLHGPNSSAPQGKVSLWVDILSAEDAKRFPIHHIKPPAPEPYELRVIIWGVREMTIKDEITEQNDLYVTGRVGDQPLQSTDTHLRSKKGKGNFNWRMKFPINLPYREQAPRLRLQVWDLDFFSADDSIAETLLSLKSLCKKAYRSKGRVKMTSNGKDRIWVEDLRHPNFEGNQGRLEFSMELMPLSVANTIPAGLGRGDPNANPHLPEPEGRVHWSLFHPLDMCYEILGENMFKKLCIAFVIAAIGSALYFITPMIVSQIVANSVTKK